MKVFKNLMFKRIVIYLCCTLLFTSSLFMSYQVPVYAETTYEDLLKDAVEIACAAAGIWAVAQTGGAMAPLIIPYIEKLAGTGFNVYDYVTQDPEAGTTTISADFVNLVLQAYKEYKEENGEKFDGVMNPGTDGYYHYDSVSAVKFWSYMDSSNCSITFTDINTLYPCAALVYSNRLHSGTAYVHRAELVFYNKAHDEFYTLESLADIPPSEKPELADFPQVLGLTLYLGKPHYVETNTTTGVKKSGEGYPFMSMNAYGALPKESYIQVTSSDIPVYHGLSELKKGLRTGDFSAAYNYGVAGGGETPSYTGTYEGGDITILTEKLDGIQGKLDELDKTDKDIAEKLKELLEWLKLSGGGGGGGTDMAATNGWLEKIYAKVSQIFEKMSETVSGAADTAHAQIQQTLDEMLAQIKKIKHWTMADTAANAADAVADWLDFIKGIFDDVENGAGNAVSALSSAMGDSANLMKTKFPFCIPWDVYLIIGFLAEEPQTPVFRFPIKLERLGIEEYIEVDLKEFEIVSSISRTLLTVLYCYGLLNLTMKVFPVAKEGD